MQGGRWPPIFVLQERPPSANTSMVLCVFSTFLALGLALTTQLDTQQQQKSELHTTRTGGVIFSGKITTVFSADLRLAERLTAAVLVEQVERTALILSPPAVGSVARSSLDGASSL